MYNWVNGAARIIIIARSGQEDKTDSHAADAELCEVCTAHAQDT